MWAAWFLIVIMLSPLFYWDLKVDIMCRYKQNGCHEILHYILHLTNGGLMRRPHQRPSCCNQQQSIQIKHFLSIPWKSEKVYYLTSKRKNSGQECLWFEYKHRRIYQTLKSGTKGPNLWEEGQNLVENEQKNWDKIRTNNRHRYANEYKVVNKSSIFIYATHLFAIASIGMLCGKQPDEIFTCFCGGGDLENFVPIFWSVKYVWKPVPHPPPSNPPRKVHHLLIKWKLIILHQRLLTYKQETIEKRKDSVHTHCNYCLFFLTVQSLGSSLCCKFARVSGHLTL